MGKKTDNQLAAAVKELDTLILHRTSLADEAAETEKQIQIVRRTINDLAKIRGDIEPEQEWPHLFADGMSAEIGLTDAVRDVLMADNQYRSPVEIRDELKVKGFNLRKYKNALANIHIVLKRLERNGEAIKKVDRGRFLYTGQRRAIFDMAEGS